MGARDIGEARSALQACDPSCGRDEWVRLAMAAKSAGLDLDTFDAWSAQADSYRERDTRAVWQSIRRTDGVGPATLFKAAAQAGWAPDGCQARNGASKASPRPTEPTKPPRPGMGAAEVWGRCVAAAAEHDYIAAKRGTSAGLRVVPAGDPLTVAGQRMAGALVVPVLPFAGGDPVSLQFIATPEQSARWKAAGRPGKLNLPGAPVAGAFVVGELAAGGTAFVCEGIGQAWACWQATGHAAVCVFGWSRVRGVAAELRQRDPSARLVIVPDVGKESEAEAIARELGAQFVQMPEGWPPNADVNDFAQRDGYDALEVLLSDAGEPADPSPDEQASAPAVWTLPPVISGDELRAARLTPRCIVENYLFADVGSIIAPGSTGKTTATLYEAAHIVLGRRLWGLQVVTPGPVIIITAEDRREFLVARLREICAALRLSEDELARVLQMVRIDDRTTSIRKLTAIVSDVVVGSGFADEVVAAAKALAPVLVQFDPLVSFGVGEARTNDAEQALIEAARIISGGLDCAVRYVQHTGKGPALDKRIDQYTGRGGSALADGCRMVTVMQALDEAELLKATGESLPEGESAFALHRPKLSYAPPQRSAIYVRRTGYAFEVLRAKMAQAPEARSAAMGEQVARFITSELQAGRRHTRNTLEQLRPESLSRPDVRQALAWLTANGRLYDAEIVDETGKRPSTGARTYLAVTGEPTANR